MFAGAIWFRDVRRELINEADGINLKSQILDIELKHILEDSQRFTEELKADTDSLQRREKSIPDALGTKDILRDKGNSLRNQGKAVEIKKAELDHERAMLRDNIKEFKNVRMLFMFLSVVGFLITAIGLRLWYVRLQKYQDKRVRSGKE